MLLDETVFTTEGYLEDRSIGAFYTNLAEH